MDIAIRHYDRVLLIGITGQIAESDLIQVVGFINSVSKKIGAIVLDVRSAQVDVRIANALFRLRTQYEKSKIRFLVVSPDVIGADAATPGNALGMIKGMPETVRIQDIFKGEVGLEEIKKEIAKLRATLLQQLGLSETPEQPVAKEELTRKISSLEEKNLQLLKLFKTLSSEIHQLQGKRENLSMPGSDNPVAVRVAEVKRRALDVIKTQGILK